MREYGQIQCGFWQSEDAQSFTDAGKLLAAYLLTGPHSNGIGCYRCPDGYVMEDLGWSAERVSEGFAELFGKGFAYRFKGVVVIPKFLSWNKIANGNVAKARMGEFNALPNGEAKAHAARAMLTFCGFLTGEDRAHLETVCQTVPQTVCQPEPNPTQPREKPTHILSSPTSSATPPAEQLDLKVGAASSSPAAKPADLGATRAQRLAQVTKEAIEAFNASKLVKPNGGRMPTVRLSVGKDVRQKEVERCLSVAREICLEDNGNPTVTPEFWEQYFLAVLEDDFYSGRQGGGKGHENWTPDFELLTRRKTMLKIYDRAAADEEAA